MDFTIAPHGASHVKQTNMDKTTESEHQANVSVEQLMANLRQIVAGAKEAANSEEAALALRAIEW